MRSIFLRCPHAMPVQKLRDTNEIWNALDGIFACVIVDEATGEFLAARDPIGVCSFYWGRGKDGSTWFSSEMKALQTHCQTFDIFPPVCSTSSILALSFHMLGAEGVSAMMHKMCCAEVLPSRQANLHGLALF